MDDLSVDIDPDTGYFRNIDTIRKHEYPQLKDTVYLDHAGTTLYAKSLIDGFSRDLTTNLFGNPHSTSSASQLSTHRVDNIRLQVLRFFNADPDKFDVVFVANATAAIKLVADAFRDHQDGFWYGYHVESHTSLVGVRELASQGSRCFADDGEADAFIDLVATDNGDCRTCLQLFGYPGQSNLTGHRFSLEWCKRINSVRKLTGRPVYTLYDAAGLLSTAPLDLSDAMCAPDFTAVSFYKIFGFPDLGALMVKKEASDVLLQRKYFGGGTVDMVVALDQVWHVKRYSSLHAQLEDGTLPFHNIIALESAFRIHQRLYGGMTSISRHCQFLAHWLSDAMVSLRHSNGEPVCELYTNQYESSGTDQGPVVAFNLKNAEGGWIGHSEVEKLAIVLNIQLRTGGLCNPGGVASYLNLSAAEMRHNYASGKRCGDDNDIFNGKPTGVIRISPGAMSSLSDVHAFIDFLNEFFVEQTVAEHAPDVSASEPSFRIDGLSVFPIKSCAAYQIPANTPWEVLSTGLAWDREWCLVHLGTGGALSQKRFPKMALLSPSLNIQTGVLTIQHNIEGICPTSIDIPLEEMDPLSQTDISTCTKGLSELREHNICGSHIGVQTYTSSDVADFFTSALGVPCTLARLPCPDARNRSTTPSSPSSRSSSSSSANSDGSNPSSTSNATAASLSNDSPILLISKSSINQLNTDIEINNTSPSNPNQIPPSTFRANILIRQALPTSTPSAPSPLSSLAPYVEDTWRHLRIFPSTSTFASASIHSPARPHTLPVDLSILGPCQRCQMVCVDQRTGTRSREPFSTLAKTRRREGKVWFGVHCGLVAARAGAGVGTGGKRRIRAEVGVGVGQESRRTRWYVQVGDRVVGW